MPDPVLEIRGARTSRFLNKGRGRLSQKKKLGGKNQEGRPLPWIPHWELGMVFEETTGVHERMDHKASQTPWLSLTQITPLPSYELPSYIMIHLFLYMYYQILFVNFLSDLCIYFIIVSFNSWCNVCSRFYQLNKCRCRCICRFNSKWIREKE